VEAGEGDAAPSAPALRSVGRGSLGVGIGEVDTNGPRDAGGVYGAFAWVYL
jgi:hypothetical protein